MPFEEIINHIKWPALFFFVLVIIIFICKDQLRQSFSRIEIFEFQSRNRKFKIKFGERVREAKVQAREIEKMTSTSGIIQPKEQIAEYPKHSSRELVLEAWGAMKQTVYNACSTLGIHLTPATGISAAVGRLLNSNAIDDDMASLLGSLDMMGHELSKDTGLKPQEDDAVGYKQLANIAVDWMMMSILSPPQPEEEEETKEPIVKEPARDTVVGGYFQPPRPDQPAAILVGIGGPVEGQRFAIEKEQYQIGSAADNDLCIPNDDYVSGRHAALYYENDSLLLADLKSRNGTYLNDQRVTEGALRVRSGDRIQIGESVLQITEVRGTLEGRSGENQTAEPGPVP